MIKKLDALRIGGDPVEWQCFLIMEKINEIISYLNQEAAKGGSDSSRVAVGTKTDSSNPKPPRKSLKARKE